MIKADGKCGGWSEFETNLILNAPINIGARFKRPSADGCLNPFKSQTCLPLVHNHPKLITLGLSHNDNSKYSFSQIAQIFAEKTKN